LDSEKRRSGHLDFIAGSHIIDSEIAAGPPESAANCSSHIIAEVRRRIVVVGQCIVVTIRRYIDPIR
jgi:hypothetical protein